jgi:hypothetical protein
MVAPYIVTVVSSCWINFVITSFYKKVTYC